MDDVDGQPVDRHVVFGQVVGVHIDDRFIKDGRLDTAAMKPIARCGYDEYAVVESVFAMTRPPELMRWPAAFNHDVITAAHAPCHVSVTRLRQPFSPYRRGSACRGGWRGSNDRATGENCVGV